MLGKFMLGWVILDKVRTCCVIRKCSARLLQVRSG
jgi:hypothetical protein